MAKLIGGTINVRVDSGLMRTKGSWNVGLGNEKRSAVVGSVLQGVHGYTREAGVPFIEGPMSIGGGLNPQSVAEIKNATIIAELEDGSQFHLFEAWYAGEAVINTKEGEMTARFEGTNAKLVV